MAKLSIIIPSRNELFLEKTIRDVLEKATGNIDVYPVLDGYEPPESELVDDPRVHYIRLEPTAYTKKRHGINLAASISTGDYLMSLDAHCMMAKGFDEQLIKDHQPNWVQIPRRNRLDAENWCLQDQVDARPPIDYEYIIFHSLVKDKSIHGFKWDERTKERWDIPIDDTLCCQASCWFMTKEYFTRHNFMDLKYQGWGQESEELCMTAWLTGGRVVTNKNTNYAHLHKGIKYGRGYHMTRSENRKSYEYSYDFWFNNRPLEGRIHDIDWLIDKFMPIPGWPEDWREKIGYGK